MRIILEHELPQNKWDGNPYCFPDVIRGGYTFPDKHTEWYTNDNIEQRKLYKRWKLEWASHRSGIVLSYSDILQLFCPYHFFDGFHHLPKEFE